MPTGAAHYRMAEELIAKADEREHPDEPWCPDYRWTPQARANLLTEADVHASLACAAAYIEPIIHGLAPGEGDDERILVEWAEVTSA